MDENSKPPCEKKPRMAAQIVPAAESPAAVEKALKANGGILLATCSFVSREMYNGRSILSPNSQPEHADHRGYVPVERWIMSKTIAENPIMVDAEGVSLLLTPDGSVRLDKACEDSATDFALFGPYSKSWPLTKVLDIGGVPHQPSFAKEGKLEVPPIPAHVHPGYVQNGACRMQEGKLEAYFFPPVDDSTVYAGSIPESEQVITRLGLMPGVTKEQVRAALDKFGVDDELYSLLQVYRIEANTGWTIQPGILHAPGPWPTFEIQRAQDDAHILAWKLGQPVKDGEELSKIWASNFKKGLRDADDVMAQTIHFKGSLDPKFQEKWFRPCAPIERGAWGSRRRIFHHEFNGEGFEVLPGQSYERPAGDEPCAALVWSGCGELVAVGAGTFPSLRLEALTDANSEFLVTPRTRVRITNTHASQTLFVYTVLPISTTESWFVSPQDWVD